MKTPISYYGGKQTMAKQIINLIPSHQLYCEPFFGGGAVYFCKEPSKIEIINDTNREVVNFYRTVQNDFTALEKEIRITLHSRDLHRKAKIIYQNPDMFSELKRAWAFWTLASQSFSSELNTAWSYSKKDRPVTATSIKNKRKGFTEDYAIRLQNTQIECDDAIKIMSRIDSENTFFYCDPPYYNANMGHYDGYTIADYELLLKTLANSKGKFILSSYSSDILEKYTKAHHWYKVVIEKPIAASLATSRKKAKRIEVITANYPLK